MLLKYYKLSPTGNITLLVDTPVPRSRHAAVAAALLGRADVGGEQVGFLEPAADPRARLRLQMMGGEFCGNAAMSVGAMLARQLALADGASESFELEVSGCAAPVPVTIARRGDAWRGTVAMPLPEALETIGIDADGEPRSAPLVRMPGIAHLILPAEWGLREDQLRRWLPAWNRRVGADALGALIWDQAAVSIDPLVYVPSAGTLVREHGCGSGTAAIGAWQALRAGRDYRGAVRQPGGEIAVDARLDGGRVTHLAITGTVRLIDEGTVDIGA